MSLRIAEVFGKQHKHVLDKIGQILNDSAENSAQCFKPSKYKDAIGTLVNKNAAVTLTTAPAFS